MFEGVYEANHAVGVVVGGFVGLEFVHARVAFLAHFAWADFLLVMWVGFGGWTWHWASLVQKKDIRAALALSVSACGSVFPCCDAISNTSWLMCFILTGAMLCRRFYVSR